jgi:hypothetical protein
MAAIFYAILNSAKCSRVPRWHHADSESRHSWLSFDTKNKTIGNIWRFHWYLPDYTLWLVQMHHFNNMVDSYRKSGLRRTWPLNKLIKNKKHKNYILNIPSNFQTNFNPFHIFSVFIKVSHERDGILNKLNMHEYHWDTDQKCFSCSSVGIATMNIAKGTSSYILVCTQTYHRNGAPFWPVKYINEMLHVHVFSSICYMNG